MSAYYGREAICISAYVQMCLYSDATCRGVCTGDDDYEDPYKDLRKDGVVEYLFFFTPSCLLFLFKVYILLIVANTRSQALVLQTISYVFDHKW